jgi:hypothetical protein
MPVFAPSHTFLDGSNLAAAGVALANLATPKHQIVVESKITPPGFSAIADGNYWSVADNISLGLYYSGAYTHEFTKTFAPSAMKITKVWCMTADFLPAGTVQLSVNGVLQATTIMAPDQVGVQAVVDIDVLNGQSIGWCCSGLATGAMLPIVVGFSGTAAHQA